MCLFFGRGFVSAGFLLPLSFHKRKRRKENAKGGLGAVCFIKASLDETAHAPSPLWDPPNTPFREPLVLSTAVRLQRLSFGGFCSFYPSLRPRRGRGFVATPLFLGGGAGEAVEATIGRL
jgi:hypothetical protein